MVTATAEPKTGVFPPSFGVEIGTQRNNDCKLQCIPGERIRGAIDPRNGVIDPETGDETTPQDQSIGLAGFPKTPGQQVHVNPSKGTYSIVDPLCEDEDLCARVKRFMDQGQGYRTAGKLAGVPVRRGTLDRHAMKSLCRELVQLVESKDATFCRGPDVSITDVENMPGMFLLQPGLRTDTLMPRYEDGWDDYLDNLRKSGG